MIERHMEKNLFRQLVLLEKFYSSHTISSKILSNLLEVFPQTIEADIEILCELFDYAILATEKSKTDYCILFDKEIPLYQLKQDIYKQSTFLQVCTQFIDHKVNYLDIVETHFISVSKAYSLINKALFFFKNNGLKQENGQLVLNEIEWRLIMLNLTLKLENYISYSHPVEFELACDKLIYHVEHSFSKRIYDKSSKFYILNGLYLAYSRQQEHPINFDAVFINEIKRRPIYELVNKSWQASGLDQYFTESEIVFITLLFNANDYTFDNSHDLLIDHQKIRDIYIIQRPEMLKLIEQFSELAGTNLLGNPAFEQSLIRLVRSSWLNYQGLLNNDIHLIKPDMKPFVSKIKGMLIEWGKHFPIDIYFDTNIINRFIDESAQLLLIRKKNVQIVVVTDSHTKFLIYRDLLENNLFNMHIEPRIYRNLFEVDISQQKHKNAIVLCESNLYKQIDITGINISPISLHQVTQPRFISKFFQLLENQAEYSS